MCDSGLRQYQSTPLSMYPSATVYRGLSRGTRVFSSSNFTSGRNEDARAVVSQTRMPRGRDARLKVEVTGLSAPVARLTSLARLSGSDTRSRWFREPDLLLAATAGTVEVTVRGEKRMPAAKIVARSAAARLLDVESFSRRAKPLHPRYGAG